MSNSTLRDSLLLFTPVAQVRRTANGWSAEVQRAFIDSLARTALVTVAARSVGRTARSAYLVRQRALAQPGCGFAGAWDEALQRGVDDARARVMAGVLDPVQIPIVYRGRIVGWRTVHDTRLAIAALTAIYRERGMAVPGKGRRKAKVAPVLPETVMPEYVPTPLPARSVPRPARSIGARVRGL